MVDMLGLLTPVRVHLRTVARSEVVALKSGSNHRSATSAWRRNRGVAQRPVPGFVVFDVPVCVGRADELAEDTHRQRRRQVAGPHRWRRWARRDCLRGVCARRFW